MSIAQRSGRWGDLGFGVELHSQSYLLSVDRGPQSRRNVLGDDNFLLAAVVDVCVMRSVRLYQRAVAAPEVVDWRAPLLPSSRL